MDNRYHRHIFTTNKFHGAAFSRYNFFAELIGKPRIYPHILEERAVELYHFLINPVSTLRHC